MKKLLYIGHEFHNKTRSSDFLIELLQSEYEVSFCYVDPYSDDPYISLECLDETSFDVLVCFQIKPPIETINSNIRYDKGIFFPMFDAIPDVFKTERWYPYRQFHIICFSLTLYKSLKKSGFNAHGIQFFPKPPSQLHLGESDHVFFWNRAQDINCQTLEQLFRNTKLKRVHIHKALDPNKKFTPPSDSLAENITYSDWYPQRSDMLSDMENCALYIAPRKKEGIGMSFLEAMAMGRCVIAPDYPTMNEYITNGQTGILYSLKKTKPLKALPITDIQEATYKYMIEGYKKWERDKIFILKWICEPIKIHRLKLLTRLFWRFLSRPIKVTRMLVCCYFRGFR